ncbi:uncharacterized protein N7515_000953 [Penicillium bovifimosum]|uniref:Uncharacterized protein n=1 Tax=Penicillium bovifimosum TaxID=126998 RepID=A0A9W9HH12_9EURO|nr:uncharacterized protein N7515_000953 [Penicillium bovifimosum]KAJ5146389.1 hypothetical protein N7515_000953 [Penicillium bovifimosum]
MTAKLEVFCCDKIRLGIFKPEDYRLGIFIYWAKANNLKVTQGVEKPGLDVPFCVGVHRRPHKPRHYVPSGWGEFSEIDQRLLIQQWITDVTGDDNPTEEQKPYRGFGTRDCEVPPSFTGEVHEQRGSGEASSSSTKGNTQATEEDDASTDLLSEADSPAATVCTDNSYDAKNLFSMIQTPTGQYIISLLETAYKRRPSAEVSDIRNDMLRMHVSQELRRLSVSVNENFFFWTRLFATDQVAKCLSRRRSFDTHTIEGKAKLQEIADDLRGVSSQTPDDAWIQAMVECAIARMMERVRAEEDPQGKTEQPGEEEPAAVDDDDEYDRCSLLTPVNNTSDSEVGF